MTVSVVYLVLTLVGATTSSIGMAHLTIEGQELTASNIGGLQPIRSDEYNVFTPVQLSMLATGGAPTLGPMGTDASLVLRYPHGPVQSVVFWDTLLLRLGPFLPDAQLFAAHWWLPTLLVLLCMPTWFVLMGGRRQLGWLAGILVALVPCNFWWSMQPSMLIGYTLLGCTSMLAAARRLERGQRLIPAAQIALAGLCIAGLPSNYLIWAVLLGGGVLLASGVRLITLGHRWALITLAITGVIAAALGAGVLLEGLDGLRSVTETVYPGQRRASAAPVGTGLLFGAPTLIGLESLVPTASNQSELSSGYTVALIALPFAWAASASRLSSRLRLPELALGVWALGWLGWCLVTIGTLGEHIPVLSSVPPFRAAQVIGVLGIIVLGLALSHVRPGGIPLPLIAGSFSALVTLEAGAMLRQDALPTMSLWALWIAGIVTGVLVGLLLRAPHRVAPMAMTAVAAGAVVIGASPLQFGLGDFRGNPTADALHAFGETARRDGTLWASDISSFDAVMLANGVPSVSGYQRSGPVRSRWERIDPDATQQEAWNRGGGYSVFHWEEGGPTRIETNGYDLISTTIDPCTLAQATPELTTIASGHELTSSDCLSPAGTMRWNGIDVHIYSVRR